MAKCKVCGDYCEKKPFSSIGALRLLFGLPIFFGNFCYTECKREQAGGRIWFGKRWLQQFIIALVVIGIIAIIIACN